MTKHHQLNKKVNKSMMQKCDRLGKQKESIRQTVMHIGPTVYRPTHSISTQIYKLKKRTLGIVNAMEYGAFTVDKKISIFHIVFRQEPAIDFMNIFYL